jgi:hypothetical protein
MIGDGDCGKIGGKGAAFVKCNYFPKFLVKIPNI